MSNIAYQLYFFTTLIIISGFIVKRSNLLFCVQIIWMIILCSGNTNSLDFDINETLYNLAYYDESSGTIEYNLLGYAYYITRMLAYNEGLSFIQYNMIISMVAILMIGGVVRKYAKNYNVVISLIYLYPFPEMVIQKRFLPAMAIMLIGLLYLNSETLKKKLKFVAMLLLGMGFHSSVIFYSIFFALEILFYKININKRKYIISILVGIEVLSINLIPLILLNIFPDDKIQLYFYTFADKANLFTCLFWSLLQGTSIYLIHKINVGNNNKFGDFIYKINIYSICIMPLYIFDPVFSRFYRPILILNYIYLSYLIPENIVMNKKEILGGIGVIIIGLLYSIILYYAGIGNMTFERMIMPIFENNLYFY